ncbi:MAG: DUF5615 family PIN-like protein [Deltaproteobacteria bacterium]|nr:DUF5615 family PIN-like protein [Deltaproteobacteria bacterium]
MSAAHPPIVRLLIDEDLSPWAAQRLASEDGTDAVHVRDRGKLGQRDNVILDLAYKEDRILVTANVADYLKLAASRDLHAGIVLMENGNLRRHEQLKTICSAVRKVRRELVVGRDMINRVLVIDLRGSMRIESVARTK